MAETVLNVAIVAPAFVYIPLWIGINDGFFREEGLDVRVEFGGGATHGVTERIADGRSHVAIGTPEGVLLDRSEQLVIVAGHANRAALSLVAQPRFRRIEDLRGASFGVASLSEGTAFILREILMQHGLQNGDYHVVEVGTHPVRWNALQAGTLDAALQLVPFDFIAQDAGYSILAKASDYVPSYAFTTVNARRDWAGANAETLEAFLRALMRATAWLYDNASAGVELAAVKSGVPAAYVARAIDVFIAQQVVARDLTLDRVGLETVEKTLAQAGNPARGSFESAVDLRRLELAKHPRSSVS